MVRTMPVFVAIILGNKPKRLSHRRLSPVVALSGAKCFADLTSDMHYHRSCRQPAPHSRLWLSHLVCHIVFCLFRSFACRSVSRACFLSLCRIFALIRFLAYFQSLHLLQTHVACHFPSHGFPCYFVFRLHCIRAMMLIA